MFVSSALRRCAAGSSCTFSNTALTASGAIARKVCCPACSLVFLCIVCPSARITPPKMTGTMLPPRTMPATATTTPTRERSLPASLPLLCLRSCCESASSVMLLSFSSISFSLFRRAGQSRARLELIQHTAHLLQRTDVAPVHRVKIAQIHAARNCSKGVVRLQRQRKGVFPPAKAQQLPFDAAVERRQKPDRLRRQQTDSVLLAVCRDAEAAVKRRVPRQDAAGTAASTGDAAETRAAQRRTSPRKTMLLQVSKPSWGVPL